MRKFFLSCNVLLTGYSFLLSFLLPWISFDDLTMELFRHELSQNTLNLHYTLAEPEAFGIRETTSSLGNMDEDARKEELSYLKKIQKRLARFSDKKLDEKQKLTADILNWWLEGQFKAEEYYYYQEPLGKTLGIQAQLPVLLAEFPFRNQEDIDIYLELLETLPAYFEQIAAFEKEKSDKGLFMDDERLDHVLDQCRSLFPVGNDHFLATTFKERLDGCAFLSTDQRIAYEVQNLRALDRYVGTAYKGLCQVLEELKGTGTNTGGLYHTPEGRDYYKYLLKYSIGTELDAVSIHRLLEDQMESDYETILYALSQGLSLLQAGDDTPCLESPAELLTDLEDQIEKDFPEVGDISWQVKEVPESLEDFLSPAFYMTPAIDMPEQNTIYINPSYEPDRMELITTLAHEGYPGHLYQNSFETMENCLPVRSLAYVGGYTEGWGLYSEFYAYDFLDLTEMESELLRAMASLNYAICASLDLSIHGEGWSEEDCAGYLAAFGIKDEAQIHELYLNILEEPSNYLKYYLGYLEILKLKESALALSKDVTIYDFHKWFLEMGPAPFGILKQHLNLLEISPKLRKSADQDVHFLVFHPFHDSEDHFLVKVSVPFIGRFSLWSQCKEYDSFVLCTSDAGYISFFDQVVDRGG